MKTKTLTMPSYFEPAILNMDYSGLDKQDRSLLNNDLLNEGVLFCDCIKTSNPYTKLQSGAYYEAIDFTFRLAS